MARRNRLNDLRLSKKMCCDDQQFVDHEEIIIKKKRWSELKAKFLDQLGNSGKVV